MEARQRDSSAHFASAIRRAASKDLGSDLPFGTTVVASASRAGSKNAVAYPLGDRTVIWCSHDLAPQLAPLGTPTPIENDEFVSRATDLGWSIGGRGSFRILSGEPRLPAVDASQSALLDRADAAHRALIADFVESCPENDLNETEVTLDSLDPTIVAILDSDGAIAAYACARPWDIDPEFDDIGILTRPDCRGRGLGGAAVAALARQQRAGGRVQLYNCNADNIGSNRLAESVGFDLVQTVASVRFG